jgi:hypothetical protein
MPVNNSQSTQTFRRHVAPFAPLALALLMNAAPSSSPAGNGSALSEMDVPDNVTAVQCEDNIADFQACHSNYPTGCSKAAGYDPYLNYLKNETPSAATGGITFLNQPAFDNLNANTPSGLGRGNNHSSFKDQLNGLGEGKQFGIIGYLYYFEATGAESSNCELTGPDKDGGNVDFHIGIGFDSTLADQAVKLTNPGKPTKSLQQGSVIVEMTPHYRAQFQPDAGTLANLKPVLGHKVKIVGQLLVDSEHNKPADNCALDGTAAQKNHCWRYSIWELHPVTTFAYCKDDSCTQDSNNWVPLSGDSGLAAGATASGENSTETQSAGAGRMRGPHTPTRNAEPRPDQASRP